MLQKIQPMKGTTGSRVAAHNMVREWSGARINRVGLGNQTITGLGPVQISFAPTPVEDIGGWHSSGTPDLLTVPAGVSRVSLIASTQFIGAFGGSDDVFYEIQKNGVVVTPPFGGQANQISPSIFVTTQMATQAMPVIEGDVFKYRVRVTVLAPASFVIVGTAEVFLAIEAITC